MGKAAQEAYVANLRQWAAQAEPTEGAPLPFESRCAHPMVRKSAAAAMRTLRSLGCSNQSIRRLVVEIRRETTAAAAAKTWPTLIQDRNSLESVMHLAEELYLALGSLSFRARVELNAGYHDLFDNVVGKAYSSEAVADALAIQRDQLPALVDSTAYALSQMPRQGRRQSRPRLVAIVARCLASTGIRPGPSQTGRFHRACEAAFMLANVIPCSPSASIRAFIGKKRDGNRTFWQR